MKCAGHFVLAIDCEPWPRIASHFVNSCGIFIYVVGTIKFDIIQSNRVHFSALSTFCARTIQSVFGNFDLFVCGCKFYWFQCTLGVLSSILFCTNTFLCHCMDITNCAIFNETNTFQYIWICSHVHRSYTIRSKLRLKLNHLAIIWNCLPVLHRMQSIENSVTERNRCERNSGMDTKYWK